MTKKIWMFWQQGYAAAPSLVKRCIDSWVSQNPDYEVTVLDGTSLTAFIGLLDDIDLKREDITVQKVAALTRLALLKNYGGVWVDATVYCCTGLRTWLASYMGPDNFFAFRNPGVDRLMSNWFIAAEPESVLLTRLFDEFTALYRDHRFDNQQTEFGKQVIQALTPMLSANPEATLGWHTPVILNGLKVYPYFIFHYTFNKVVLTDPQCTALWQHAPQLDAGLPHALQAFAHSPEAERLALARDVIQSNKSPVFKLDWRVNMEAGYWPAVFQELSQPRRMVE